MSPKCTWFECTESAKWSVKSPSGQPLGFNCDQHKPVKTAKDYLIEAVEDCHENK